MTYTVAPTEVVAGPVSLADMKEWLAVEHTEHDPMIEGLLESVCESVERVTHLALSRRSYVYEARFYRASAVSRIVFPRKPLVSIESVEYVSRGEALPLVLDMDYASSGDYFAFIGGRAVFDGSMIRVRFTAGFEEGQVPPPIIIAIKREVRRLYDHRSDVVEGTTANQLAPSALDAIAPYLVRYV